MLTARLINVDNTTRVPDLDSAGKQGYAAKLGHWARKCQRWALGFGGLTPGGESPPLSATPHPTLSLVYRQAKLGIS